MINLLPEEEKKVLEMEENWRLVSILEILGLVFFLCLILVLFSIKISVSGKLESQKILVDVKEKQLKVSEIQVLREEIKMINQELFKLETFYQQQFSLVEILEKISKNIPPKIYLNSLYYSKDNFQISLSGFSPNREILFELKENLEREFKDVYFPPQNWVKPKDIDFSVNFKIRTSPSREP